MDMDEPVQVTIAERQKPEGKGGWFGRGRGDRPKTARPTGMS